MATSTDLNAAIDAVQESLHGGEPQPLGPTTTGEEAVAEAPGLAEALQKRLGSLPWWVISVIAHAILLFLFVTFFAAARMMTATSDDLFVQSEFTEPEEPEVDMKKPRDLFRNPVDAPAEVSVEQPVLAQDDPDAEVSDHFETDNDMDSATARGDENAFSTVPLGGTGVIGTIGVGGGGPAGVYGFRNGGGRRKCIMRYGGSKQSESAVEAALKWLADHQEADGHWDCAKHEGKKNLDVGPTALAVLAFLGAGYTEKAGKYRDNVRRGAAWLISKQAENGEIGVGYREMWHANHYYHHAMAGLALAEAAGMAKVPETVAAAQKAIEYSVNEHQKPYGGWRYKPKTNRGDVSLTGWFVMQLKSAKMAGLRFETVKAFSGAMNFVNECEAKSKDTRYEGRFTYQPGQKFQDGKFLNTTAIGMLCCLFCGEKRDRLLGGAEYLMQYLPTYNAADGAGGVSGGRRNFPFYYYYYGTLVMFQMGGRHWKAWNGVMRDTLIENQCTAKDGDNNGSWSPLGGADDKVAGRVYSTAMGALCLEVYYRYLPMYKD